MSDEPLIPIEELLDHLKALGLDPNEVLKEVGDFEDDSDDFGEEIEWEGYDEEAADEERYETNEELGIESLTMPPPQDLLQIPREYKAKPLYFDMFDLEDNDKDYTAEENLRFMVEEEMTGNRKPDSINRRQQIEGKIKTYFTARELYRYAYKRGPTDATVQLEVSNQFGMPLIDMKRQLWYQCSEKKDSHMKQYFKNCDAIADVKKWSDSTGSVSTSQLAEKVKEVQELMKSKMKNLEIALTYLFLANGRFVSNMLYLPGIKLKTIVQRAALVLTGDPKVARLIEPCNVDARLFEVTETEQFIEDDKQKKFFSLTIRFGLGSIRLLHVMCREMSDPRTYLEQYFLLPEDQVMAWNEKHIPKPGYIWADVMVVLGSCVEPPYRASQERWRVNAAKATKSSGDLEFLESMMESLKASKTDFDKFKGPWDELKERFRPGCATDEDEKHFGSDFEDPFDMTCSVEF